MFNTLLRQLNPGNQMVLCTTSNYVVSKHASDKLMDENIPFFLKYYRIPWILRDRFFRGSNQFCLIYINKREFKRARECMTALDRKDKRKLWLRAKRY